MRGTKAFRTAAALLCALLLMPFSGCIKQDAYLIYGETMDTPAATEAPASTDKPTATPEEIALAPLLGDSFSTDEKGVPIIDSSTHYFTYYLTFSNIRIYEEKGSTYMDGLCTNYFDRDLTGELRICFTGEDGKLYGYGDIHTATGDLTLSPGENRIYAEIRCEVDVQLMEFSLEIQSPFSPG